VWLQIFKNFAVFIKVIAFEDGAKSNLSVQFDGTTRDGKVKF
jgi:hypothetical protein